MARVEEVQQCMFREPQMQKKCVRAAKSKCKGRGSMREIAASLCSVCVPTTVCESQRAGVCVKMHPRPPWCGGVREGRPGGAM